MFTIFSHFMLMLEVVYLTPFTSCGITITESIGISSIASSKSFFVSIAIVKSFLVLVQEGSPNYPF